MKQVAFLFLLLPIKLFACQFAKTELERTFLQAAQELNEETLKDCLLKGVNPNIQDRIFRKSALHHALQDNPNLSIISTLLNHPGVDVNIQDGKNGCTPLHDAASLGGQNATINHGFARIDTNKFHLFVAECKLEPAKQFLIPDLQKDYYDWRKIYSSDFKKNPLNSNEVFIDLSKLLVKALLSKKANPGIVSFQNYLPIQCTYSSDSFEILIHSGSPINPKILSASFSFFNSATITPLLATLESKSFRISNALGLIGISREKASKNPGHRAPRATARILLYYCKLYDLLKSTEGRDATQPKRPVLPKELIQIIATKATKHYIESFEIEKKNLSKPGTP